jgi:hypothetical protein
MNGMMKRCHFGNNRVPSFPWAKMDPEGRALFIEEEGVAAASA